MNQPKFEKFRNAAAKIGKSIRSKMDHIGQRLPEGLKGFFGRVSDETGTLSSRLRKTINTQGSRLKIGLSNIKDKLTSPNLRRIPDKEETRAFFLKALEASRSKLHPKILLARAKKFIDETDPQALVTRAQQALQNKKTHQYGFVLTLILCAYFIADMTSMLTDELIPPPPAYIPARAQPRTMRNISSYNIIFTRNLINSRGLIPGDDAQGEIPTLDGPPVRTTLPFELIGTLILEDELRSVATIEDKTLSLVYPVQVNDEIPSKAKILSVQSARVVFVNKTSGRKEYIDIPKDPNAHNPTLTLGTTASSTPGIEKVAPTQYNVSRNEVDKALADFNNILTQARAVPNFENGVAAGYKLFQIVPDSIYDKLGLKNGDVITGLNGSPINDPGKAFEMLNELKTSSHLELQVKKGGAESTYSYEIH